MTDQEQPRRSGPWDDDPIPPSHPLAGPEDIAALVRPRPAAGQPGSGGVPRPDRTGPDRSDPGGDPADPEVVPPPIGRTGNSFDLPTGSVGVLRGSRPLGGDGWDDPTVVAPEQHRTPTTDRSERWSNVPRWSAPGGSAATTPARDASPGWDPTATTTSRGRGADGAGWDPAATTASPGWNPGSGWDIPSGWDADPGWAAPGRGAGHGRGADGAGWDPAATTASPGWDPAATTVSPGWDSGRGADGAGWDTAATTASPGWDTARGGTTGTGGYDLLLDDDRYAGPFADDATRHGAAPGGPPPSILGSTGAKVLLSGAAMLLVLAVAHVLGVMSLPFLSGDDGQEVAMSEQTTPSTPTTDGASTGAVISRTTTTVSGSVDTAPITTGPVTTPAPAPDPDPNPEPSTPTSQATTSTTAAPTTTTTLATTTSTASTTTSTTFPIPGPGQVALVVAQPSGVPADTPAGTYGARAGGTDCVIVIVHADAVTETATTQAGRMIRFDLVDGDTVTPTAGCPAVYDVS